VKQWLRRRVAPILRRAFENAVCAQVLGEVMFTRRSAHFRTWCTSVK
jgi:hypothetical protein